MFGLFETGCPLPLNEKVSAECWFRNLYRALKVSNIASIEVLVLGHPELPQNYHGSGNCILDVFDFVSGRMGIVASDIEFSMFPATAAVNSNSTYTAPQLDQLAQVVVADNLPDDPERLVAVLARSLAYEVVRTRCPELWDTEDIEVLVEIIPMFFGFGVFMANTTLRESNYSDAMMFAWKMSKSGILAAQTHGYLGALFAWVRDELSPPWAKALRLDAKETLKASLRHLHRTNDAIFERDLLGIGTTEQTSYDRQAQFESKSDTLKFNALIELQVDLVELQRFETDIVKLLKTKNVQLRSLTIETLGLLPNASESTLHALINQASSSQRLVRRSLADCLKPGTIDDEIVKNTLLQLIADQSITVAATATLSLAQFPDLPDNTADAGFALLKRALAAQDDYALHASVTLLFILVDDWEAMILKLDDPSWQCMLRDYLNDLTNPDGESSRLPVKNIPATNLGESRIL